MTFSDEERYPGDVTTLQVRADADSLCSVAVVDKSVHVLGGDKTLNIGQVRAQKRVIMFKLRYGNLYFLFDLQIMSFLREFELNEHSHAKSELSYCPQHDYDWYDRPRFDFGELLFFY